MLIYLLIGINPVTMLLEASHDAQMKPMADGVLGGQHNWGHCFGALGMRSAYSGEMSFSFFLSLLSSSHPRCLSHRVHSESGSRVPEDLIYFTWLSVSQGSGGDNCHFPSISTKGRVWGQVSVAGLMSTWALQGLPGGQAHTCSNDPHNNGCRTGHWVNPASSQRGPSSLTWLRSHSY